MTGPGRVGVNAVIPDGSASPFRNRLYRKQEFSLPSEAYSFFRNIPPAHSSMRLAR
jgi:hypothetical protein